MKYFLGICLLSTVLLISCAKPTVINVVLPGDKKLNCEQLESSLVDAQEFRRKAIGVTGNTGKNQAAAILFWPALMMTYVNAHEAIVAASERSVNLINLLKKKKCKNVDNLLAQVQTTHRVQTLGELSQVYKDLKELYESGALTEDEFRKEKRQVLGQ